MEREKAINFIEENLKTIFAYSLSRVSHREDAEDLAGDIVAAILQSAGRADSEDRFYGYVWSIAANTYKNFLRKRNRYRTQGLDEDISDRTDFIDELLEREERNRLRREISLLAREYRECTVAYYFDELSCAEVSAKLGISLEMVKYYLFKTRKILKEGISMEREIGEKSFRPATFEFNTIYAESYNPEYSRLFSRKLPGQILLAAYDAPVTVRELAVELGVASVYLEDEIAMLEKYDLISRLPSSKYRTKLVIFTTGFWEEFQREAAKDAIPMLENILTGIEGKLDKIREISAICEKIADARLLWAVLWMTMRQGHLQFEKREPAYQEWDTIYRGAAGINYGITWEDEKEETGCFSFAGYAAINEKYYASGADFGVLPKKNRYFLPEVREAVMIQIEEVVSGDRKPDFMILTEGEEKQIQELLSEEAKQMAALYAGLFECAVRLMHVHAPENVQDMIDRIVCKTLFFRTVGLIGYYALKTEILKIPDSEGPVAMYIREN